MIISTQFQLALEKFIFSNLDQKMKVTLFLLAILFGINFNLFANSRFIRVMFNQDASSSATIIWDQNTGTFLNFYIDTIEPSINNYVNSYKLSSVNLAKGMNNHIIRLKDLKPNTRYYFIIQDSEGFNKTYYFSTVSNSSDTKLSFIAGGDSRDGREVRIKANKLVAKLKPHAVLFNGDFIGLDIDKQWLEWFVDWEYTISENGRISPLVVTRGNHELTNKVMVELFDCPNKKIYYETNFGGKLLNLISLNSEILKIGSQKFFLRKTLEEHKDYYWQLPQYHRPVRAHVASKKEMQTQYKNFVPLFEKYKNVRLCLENDSHTCKVTWPIVSSSGPLSDEGFERNDEKGIVYAGEGCWGAPLRAADDSKSWTRDAEGVNQFNWIFISKEKIELRTVLYENENEVGELREENRFEMPLNLKLWGPKAGTLVEIFPQK